jgi:Ca-activated chloride channel family protein
MAAIDPEQPISSIAFFVDGRQLCLVDTPPFHCYWDAGTAMAEHQIRAVARLRGGARVTETIRTRGPHANRPAAAGPVFSTHVDAVQLTVTVSDGGSQYAVGLPQSAFHLSEDGVAQSISSFAAEHVPLDLVVAVDISASMAPAMPKLKEAVKEFLGAVPAGTSVTILAFNDAIVELANPSTRPDTRAAAIDRLVAHGATSLYDVVARGIALVEQRTGRKALIVFSDGQDEGSRVSIEDVERRLQATDAVVYAIGQGRGLELDELKKVMRRLVEPTGGRALFTNKIEELRGRFADLLSELSHQYLVGYIPTNTQQDGRWRRIKVTVDGHHQVRTRQGYLAPDRAPQK